MSALTHDGDASTYWRSKTFVDGPRLAPFKQGVGIMYEIGAVQKVSSATIDLKFSGERTKVALYGADSLSASTPLTSMEKIAETATTGTKATLTAKKAREHTVHPRVDHRDAEVTGRRIQHRWLQAGRDRRRVHRVNLDTDLS